MNEITDESEAGINIVNYDLSINEQSVADLQKEMQTSAKDGKEIKINAAGNGKYYLPVGEYTVEIRAGEAVEKQMLKVEAPRGGSGRRSEPVAEAHEED